MFSSFYENGNYQSVPILLNIRRKEGELYL